MTTFSLEVCHRLAKLLGEANEPMFRWGCSAGCCEWGPMTEEEFQEKYLQEDIEKIKGGAVVGGWYYDDGVKRYRLDDLTAEVWEEIGERLGWAPKGIHYTEYAIATYACWLNGGYEEADKYLAELLK